MAIPASVIQEITERTDIVDLVSRYVTLKKSGADYVGLCPFHSEKTPSFRVTPSKQMFYCFGCQKGGGPVQFLMQIENLNFPDAVKKLGNECGIQVSAFGAADDKAEKRRKQMLSANKEAARYFYSCLAAPCGLNARKYLKDRALTPEIIKKFGIGFAPDSWDALKKYLFSKGFSEQILVDAGLISKTEKGSTYDRFRNRVMFPIFDVTGNVIGFGGRVLDDSKPKYLNTADTPVFDKSANLYALNLAKNDKSAQVVVVEGYMDVVTLYQYGIERAVASLGTALTAHQVRLLKRYSKEVVLCYDGDGAGQKATQRAVGLLREAEVRARVVSLADSGAKDPDEFLKKFGVDRFLERINSAKAPVLYKIAVMKENYDLSQPEQLSAFLKETAEEIALLNEPVERDVFVRKIAELYPVKEEALAEQVKWTLLRRKQTERKQEKAEVQRVARQRAAVSAGNMTETAEGRLFALALKYNEALTAVSRRGGDALFENEGYKTAVQALLAMRESGEKIPEADVFITMLPLEISGLLAGAVQSCASVSEPEKVTNEVIDKLFEIRKREQLKKLAAEGDVEGVNSLLHNKEDEHAKRG